MIRPTVLLGLLFLAGLPAGISARELPCKDNGIVVHGAEPQDVQDGCEAVNSAANFFESSGLAMPKSVRILLVDGQSIPFPEVHEMGSYDARQNAIRILAYQAAVKATEMNAPGLGRVTTRAHWRSYINHELTHAAIHTDCSKACPSRAIHEYVAAVAQIASLPEEQRRELLKPYRDLEPFDRLSEVTETYYAINPHYFAVKSYKHYRQLSDPRAFFRDALHLSD